MLLIVSIIGCLGSLGFDWDFNPDLGPFIFALVSSGRVAPCLVCLKMMSIMLL